MIENEQELTKVVNVSKCARCGEDHPITAREFKMNKLVCGGMIYSHWGLCPITRDPVLIAIVENPDDSM